MPIDFAKYNQSWYGMAVIPSPDIVRMQPADWDAEPSAQLCAKFFRPPVPTQLEAASADDADIRKTLVLPASFQDQTAMKFWQLSARLVRIYVVWYKPQEEDIILRHSYIEQPSANEMFKVVGGQRKLCWHSPSKYYSVTHGVDIHEGASPAARARAMVRLRRFNQIVPVMRLFDAALPAPEQIDALPPLCLPDHTAAIDSRVRLEQCEVSLPDWTSYVFHWAENFPLAAVKRMRRRCGRADAKFDRNFADIVKATIAIKDGQRWGVVQKDLQSLLEDQSNEFNQQLFEAITGITQANTRIVPLSLLPNCSKVRDIRVAVQGPLWGTDSKESMEGLTINSNHQILDMTCSHHTDDITVTI